MEKQKLKDKNMTIPVEVFQEPFNEVDEMGGTYSKANSDS